MAWQDLFGVVVVQCLLEPRHTSHLFSTHSSTLYTSGALAFDLPTLIHSRLFLVFLCLTVCDHRIRISLDGESGRALGALLMSLSRKNGSMWRQQQQLIEGSKCWITLLATDLKGEKPTPNCFVYRHNKKTDPAKGKAWRLNKSACISANNARKRPISNSSPKTVFQAN